MFKPEDLFRLQQHQGEALITITTPMERVFPASDKNRIVMKNLLKQTEQKLEQAYDPIRSKNLMDKVRSLESNIDYRNTGDGMAIFVSEDEAKIIDLPFSPMELVSVGNSFQTRELLNAYHRNPQYLLLVLSLEDVRLMRGIGKNMYEIKNDSFPATYSAPARTEPLSDLTRQDIDSEELGELRIFLGKVDDHLFNIVKESKTPLFVVGEPEYISYLRKRDRSGKSIKGEIGINLAHFTEAGLVDRVYPLVETYTEAQRDRQIHLLQEAIGYQRAAIGIREVWRAAKLGQIMTLLVEENYSISGIEKSNNELELEIIDAQEERKANYHSDLVDDAIEIAMQMNGEAIFVENGKLANHGRIAAILRYERIERDNTVISEG